ncbi:IucA/IucC family siderophore biosynthesis protein [Jeotgalibacillus sp. R-1-5s-1]|uniref:IucA/IucC family protein n=1 Tax=Jeotgalibacillus sp. R-1-5s-1 TaxID=2555897 RepID=UPI00106BD0CE|nr:IucA/IucC family protein [Jeotgalibacillus sp. R-1-5s-1]TFD99681.1 siderophore biosynthesis protein [Jeotgalibacillus sp. R-1-5s-1]
MIQAKQIANTASFQAFMNSYVREADNIAWLTIQEIQTISDIPLIQQAKWLKAEEFLIEVTYYSLTGGHTYGRVFQHSVGRWIPAEPLQVMIALCQKLHVLTGRCSHYDDLLYRLLDSWRAMELTVSAYMKYPSESHPSRFSFIQSEQSIPFGHWMHPTPKSRQGVSEWQYPAYVPEMKSSFQLSLFAVNQRLVKQETSRLQTPAEQIAVLYPELKLNSEEILFPLHPLQADYLLQQDWVKKAINHEQMRFLGRQGPAFYPTSSFRTLYHPSSDVMIKGSIPVQLTNSLRVNKRHELTAGVIMSRYIQKTRIQERFSTLSFIHDHSALTVLSDQQESGFELILRDNPFRHQKGIVSLAFLVQNPTGETGYLKKLILSLQEPEEELEQTAEKWFLSYLNQVIYPLIRLYDEEGIALEAHQQNVLVDISTGLPKKAYFRDNQGFYLSNNKRNKMISALPEMNQLQEEFFDEAEIEPRFTYYLFMNHLFAVINRLGKDGLITEEALIGLTVDKLHDYAAASIGSANRWLKHVLTARELPFKANLMTRLQNIDELEAIAEKAVYAYLPNPFLNGGMRDESVRKTGDQTAARSAAF